MTGKHANHPRGRRVEYVSVTCEACGAVREYSPGEMRVRGRIRFCSTACRDASSRYLQSVRCEQCGESFQPDRATRKYCSKRCAGLARRMESPVWPGKPGSPRRGDPEKQRAYHREYQRLHREHLNALARAWRKRNHEQRRELQVRRRAAKRGNDVERVNLQRIMERDKMRCHLCRLTVLKSDLQFDHVVPLVLGGDHSEINIAVSHRLCNQRKGGRMVTLF
jgi:5-methylcytosine-specific restriction endonuclease McrA